MKKSLLIAMLVAVGAGSARAEGRPNLTLGALEGMADGATTLERGYDGQAERAAVTVDAGPKTASLQDGTVDKERAIQDLLDEDAARRAEELARLRRQPPEVIVHRPTARRGFSRGFGGVMDIPMGLMRIPVAGWILGAVLFVALLVPALIAGIVTAIAD